MSWQAPANIRELVTVVPGSSYTLTLHANGRLTSIFGPHVAVLQPGSQKRVTLVGKAGLDMSLAASGPTEDVGIFTDGPVTAVYEYADPEGKVWVSRTSPSASMVAPVADSAAGYPVIGDPEANHRCVLTGSSDQVISGSTAGFSEVNPGTVAMSFVFRRFHAPKARVVNGTWRRQIGLCATGGAIGSGGETLSWAGNGSTFRGIDGDESGASFDRLLDEGYHVGPTPAEIEVEVTFQLQSDQSSMSGKVSQSIESYLKGGTPPGTIDPNSIDDSTLNIAEAYSPSFTSAWWEDHCEYSDICDNLTDFGSSSWHGAPSIALFEFSRSATMGKHIDLALSGFAATRCLTSACTGAWV